MTIQRKRHICKALTWRGIATTTTLSLSYFFTQDIKTAGSIAIVDTILKFLFYYGHERVWYKYIKFGTKIVSSPTLPTSGDISTIGSSEDMSTIVSSENMSTIVSS